MIMILAIVYAFREHEEREALRTGFKLLGLSFWVYASGFKLLDLCFWV